MSQPETLRSLSREWPHDTTDVAADHEPSRYMHKDDCRRCQLDALLDAQLERFRPADESNITAMTLYRIMCEVLGNPEETKLLTNATK
jgi:hypothetical protein